MCKANKKNDDDYDGEREWSELRPKEFERGEKIKE